MAMLEVREVAVRFGGITALDTSSCPSDVNDKITGTVKIGSTVVTGIDVADPKNAANPTVVSYKGVMTKNGFPADGDFATAGAGWTVGEVTVEVLKEAAASPDGLTRASIMNAARNLSYHPSLTRDGITFKTSGEDDPYINEVQQVVQYSAATKTYTDLGPLITKFEGKTEKP